MKKFFNKKALSILLVFQIIFSMPMQAFATSSIDELLLKEELRKSADEIQYPNGLFEFLADRMNTSENLSSVEFAIVRKGGTAGKASVTFKAIDVTAKYGEDYTISVPTGIFPITLQDNSDSKPLIDSFEDIENVTVTTSSGIQSEKMQVTTSTSIQYEELNWLQSSKEVEYSGLRSARDAFTNTTSSRSTWREADRETKDIALKAQKEMFDGLPGVTYTFNFEDGEYIKKIRFNTIDDNISEDEEQVMFVLLNPEGGSLGDNICAYMNIEDNEEKEKVLFEMADDQIRVDRLSGYAEIKVRRTAGLYRYGLIRVGTAALSAEPGVDYEPLSIDLRFVPGQETQTIKIPLIKGVNSEELKFMVKLDPESPNISENNTKTIVTIIPKPSYLMEVKSINEDIRAFEMVSQSSLQAVSAVKIYLKNIEENEDSVIENNEDAYIKPKTWKSATTSETGLAQYVGTIAFAEDYDSIIKTYTTSDTVNLVPKYSEKFKDTSKVYLWGYKIERKGGLSGDRYNYVQADQINVGELYNSQVIDYYSNKPIPISSILMSDNTIAILPVFKARPCFVKINFDSTKGGMDKDSFSNGQIVKVGMMDTIEFRAYANGQNAVSGYNHAHMTDPLKEPSYYTMPTNWIEAYREDQTMDQIATFYGWRMEKYFRPIDGININPSLPGELNFNPLDTFSELTVSYGTTSLTVMADPTFEIRDKGSVAYIPDEGESQAGNSENPMVISPIEHNKMYTISGVPNEGYRMVWKDWSGDINRDGKLNQEEVDNLGKYEANFDRKAVAGNFFTYVPFYDNPLIYYSFEPKGSNTSKGVVSGRILLRGRNILNSSGGQSVLSDKPLTGVSLNINGHSIYTDEEGKFEIEHSDFRSNEYHNIVITYNGINYIGHVNVNAFTSIIINEYDAFNPFNFKAYNLTNNEEIDFRIIDNRDANYRFRFEVQSLKQGITAAKAVIRFYAKDGVERIDSKLEITPQNGAFTFEFNPSSLGIVPGDNMTVQFVDQNGLVYMEHNAGFTFKKNLNTFSLLSSFKTPLKPAVDFVGNIDATFDLGLAGKANEYLDQTGKNGTEWTITFGFSKDWEKSLSDGSEVEDEDGESSNNAAAEELKDAAKSDNIEDTVNKSVDKTNDEKKSASITSDLKFGISTSLYLRMTVDEDPSSPGYGEAYFNEMIMSATLTFDYNRKAERMTPIGVTLFVEMNIGGKLTGMTVIEKYDKKFYFNDNGEIDFSNSGTDNLNRDFTIYGKLMVKPYIQLSVGAEITGATVTLSGRADFDLNFTTTGSGNGKVRLSSELTLEVLFFEYTWEIAGKEWDLFNYGRMGRFSMDNFLGDTAGLYESAEDYQVMDRDYLNNRGQWQGENRVFLMSDRLETIPQNEKILQTGTYPYPYTLLATIGENQQLLIFLDDDISHDDRNRTQLFYSIYNGSYWSIPRKVDDDNTPDGLPWVYDIGDKVIVAWSSSVFEIDSDDTVMSVLNNRNIKARFFNKSDKTFEDVQEVTHHTEFDTYSDTEPYIAYWKNDKGKENLMIVYKKSDYKSTEGDSDEHAVVGDIINPYYFTLAYRFYDFERNVWDDRSEGGEMPGMFYGQGFIDLSKYAYVDERDIVIKDGSIWTGLWEDLPTVEAITLENMPGSDALVVDSNAIGYDNHAVLAYVVDLDNNLGTTVDREIFLQLYSFEDKQFYPPIRLTDDITGQYCLEFVSEGENVYLYYLSDGDIQSIDIGYILKEGLLKYELKGEIEGTFDKVYVLNKLKGVYKNSETVVHHSYDVVKDGEGNEIVVNEMPIDEFMVKSNNNNIYVVWVQGDITYREGIDPNSQEASLPENQYRENHIYAARKIINETSTWTDAVKITEGKGANYNDIDFEILSDDMLRIVFVKGFSQLKNVGGQMISVEDTNNRMLMTADYDINERNTTIELKPVYVKKPGYIVPLDIKIHNNSLSELKSITYEVWQVSDKVSEIAASGGLQLRGGEKKDITVLWQTPNELKDTTLQVLVKDGDNTLCSDEYKIITQSIVDVVGAYVDFVGRNKIIVSGVAVNNGNIQANEAIILAEFSGIEMGSVNIGKLGIGEVKEFILIVEIEPEMFESYINDEGSVEAVMEFSVHSRRGKGIKLSLQRYAEAQDVDTINNIESFTLKSNNIEINEQISLRIGTEINIEPHLRFLNVKSDNTRIIFESSDDAVADISASGRLIGSSIGSAVITAYVIPKINNIVLSQNSFTKVDNFETLAEKAILTKSFIVNVTKTNSNKPKEDVSEDSVKPESTDGNKITFKDVAEDAWYYDAVSFIAGRGITKGTGDGYFSPDAKLTRGQFIVMIMRAYGIEPDDNFEDNFADAKDTYYTGYLAAAKRLGLSSGIGNNLFAPDNYITRQEMFTLLYRILKAFDDLPEVKGNNYLSRFNDADQIDSWALEAMTLFVDSMIIQGSGQQINPKEETNRAQMAQVLYNILK